MFMGEQLSDLNLTLLLLLGGGALYFYVAVCRISLDVLCKSELFLRRIAFQLRHTNPYITVQFRLLFSFMLYKIHTNDSINENK
jgi:hypothetical protein